MAVGCCRRILHEVQVGIGDDEQVMLMREFRSICILPEDGSHSSKFL